MTHSRPYLDSADLVTLTTLLHYVVERKEEAEDNLEHALRHFEDWKKRLKEPDEPDTLNKMEMYLVDLGLYTGMWTSHQGDCDHYGGQVAILQCMESELRYYIDTYGEKE